MRPALLLLLLAAAPAPQVRIEVDPQPGRFFGISVSGPAPVPVAGQFRGAIALDGSASELPVVGRAETAGGRLTVRANLAYADVPKDWAERFSPDGFDFLFHGAAGSQPVSWSGRLSWDRVAVGGDERTLSRFVRLTSFELTSLSIRRSEGRAVLRVENPFSFPVKISGTVYRLEANGHAIGRGTTKGRILHPKRANAVELPFEVDHGEFFAAVGQAFAIGGDVAAELHGFLFLRFASGDVRVPIHFAGELSTAGARSGVFAPPDGATSLSPRP